MCWLQLTQNKVLDLNSKILMTAKSRHFSEYNNMWNRTTELKLTGSPHEKKKHKA